MPKRKLSENEEKDRDPMMFIFIFMNYQSLIKNQGAPEPSVTHETTSESAYNACGTPQNDNPGNDTY